MKQAKPDAKPARSAVGAATAAVPTATSTPDGAENGTPASMPAPVSAAPRHPAPQRVGAQAPQHGRARAQEGPRAVEAGAHARRARPDERPGAREHARADRDPLSPQRPPPGPPGGTGGDDDDPGNSGG